MELLDTADLDAELAHKLAFSLPSSPAFSASPLRRTLSPAKQFHLAPAGSGGTPPRTPLLQPPAGAGGSQDLQPPQQKRRTIEIVLSAVGMGLQFVHLDGGDQRAATSRPGSGIGSLQGSTADLGGQALASQASLAAQLEQQMAAPLPGKRAARTVQMLAASLDLAVSYKIEVSPLMHCKSGS